MMRPAVSEVDERKKDRQQKDEEWRDIIQARTQIDEEWKLIKRAQLELEYEKLRLTTPLDER